MSRPERRRAALDLLARVMRPLFCEQISGALRLGSAKLSETLYHPWFFRGPDGRYWITEAGWRERLAGHPCTRGD